MKNIKNTKNVITSETANVLDAVTCVRCGAKIYDDADAYYTHDGTVCSDCVGHYCSCDYCDEVVDADDLIPVYDFWNDIVEYVCPDCADEYYVCDVCGRLFNDYDSLRNGRCCECRTDLIESYHAGNPDGIQFFGDPSMSYINGYIGCELEMFGPADDIAEAVHDVAGFDFCHFENDCTVDVEIITQPRTLENIRENKSVFNAMFNAIQSAGGHDGELAGLHVHVSRTAFGNTTQEQSERIGRVMTLFSREHWPKLVTLSRRNIDSVERWARPHSDDVYANKGRAGIGGYHEMAVNVEHSDTVEFRLGRSTTSCATFIKWIELIAYIVRRSESLSAKSANDFGAWFLNAPPSIMELIDLKGVHIPPVARVWTIEELKGLVEILCARVVVREEQRATIMQMFGGECDTNVTAYDVLKTCGLNDSDIAGINTRMLPRD